MTQMHVQSVEESAAVQLVPSRRFVIRFVVSSISSVAGSISFVLIGPTISRIAAVDPALEVIPGLKSGPLLRTTNPLTKSPKRGEPPCNPA